MYPPCRQTLHLELNLRFNRLHAYNIFSSVLLVLSWTSNRAQKNAWTTHLGLRLWPANTTHHHEIKRERKLCPQRQTDDICLGTLSRQCDHPSGKVPKPPRTAHRSALSIPERQALGSAATIPLLLALDAEFSKSTGWCYHLAKRSEYFLLPKQN